MILLKYLTHIFNISMMIGYEPVSPQAVLMRKLVFCNDSLTIQRHRGSLRCHKRRYVEAYGLYLK